MKNYSPLVLSHYRNPRNFGKLERPTDTAEELNPLCGDEVKVYLRFAKNTLLEMKYEARGCALSIAAASRLSEEIKGKQIREIRRIGKSEIEKWLKVKVGLARESCVTLALKAIQRII